MALTMTTYPTTPAAAITRAGIEQLKARLAKACDLIRDVDALIIPAVECMWPDSAAVAERVSRWINGEKLGLFNVK